MRGVDREGWGGLWIQTFLNILIQIASSWLARVRAHKWGGNYLRIRQCYNQQLIMSGKRGAQYQIDEKSLEAREEPREQPKNAEKDRNGSQPERIIVNVKKEEAAKEKVVEQKSEKTELSSLFNNSGISIFNNVGLFQTSTPSPKITIDFAAAGLFNSNGPNAVPKPQPQPFSSLFSNNGFNPKPQEKPEAKLFGRATSTAVTPALFAHIAPASSSLFGGSGNSIFSFKEGNIPPIKAGQAEDDEGDSADLDNEQKMEADPSKSTGKYEYKQQMKVLFTGLARKYKRNGGDLVENIEILVQLKEESEIALLVARLTATKHSIFNGLLIKDKISVRILNGKSQNIEVVALGLNPDKKTTKDRIKLQFQTAQIGKKFFDVLEGIIAKPEQKEGEKEEKEVQQKVEK